MRGDADLAVMAAAARRSRCRTRYPEAGAGGRRRGRLERAEPPACGFRAGGILGRTADAAGGALLERHDQRWLDRPAESDPRSPAGGDRHRGRAAAQHPRRCLAAQSGSALPQCAVHPVALRAVHRRQAHRPRQVRCRGDAAPDRTRARAMGQFRSDHDAPDLGAAGERAQRLPFVELADCVPHGSSHAALAQGELDRLAQAGADLGALWRHRAARFLRHSRARSG
jgi:hypothetical protein